MLHYNQAMILNAGNDRLLCKVFPAGLRGPALAWFHKLPRNSINSFNDLWAAFTSLLLRLFHVLKLFLSVGTDVVKHYNTVGVHRSFPQGVVS